MIKKVLQEVEVGFYQHSKSGKLYEVIGVARYSEDPQQEFVVYKQLYESVLQPNGTKLEKGTLWIRPKVMFIELVEINGKKVPRFKRMQSN